MTSRRDFLKLLGIGAAALSTKKYFDLAANTWRNDEIFPEFDPEKHVLYVAEYEWKEMTASIIIHPEEFKSLQLGEKSFESLFRAKINSYHKGNVRLIA